MTFSFVDIESSSDFPLITVRVPKAVSSVQIDWRDVDPEIQKRVISYGFTQLISDMVAGQEIGRDESGHRMVIEQTGAFAEKCRNIISEKFNNFLAGKTRTRNVSASASQTALDAMEMKAVWTAMAISAKEQGKSMLTQKDFAVQWPNLRASGKAEQYLARPAVQAQLALLREQAQIAREKAMAKKGQNLTKVSTDALDDLLD